MKRRLILPFLAIAALAGGLAVAQEADGGGSEAKALQIAKRQAAEANRRSEQLEREAAAATGEAAKAQARAAVVAARIQAAEADITAAETRIRIIENLRAEQRARLAKRQEPVVRLTAALQTIARRPPALALVQPGSLDEVVHVRSLLASTLPIIRARTANVRSEIKAANELREQAQVAVASLVTGQEELKKQRLTLARLEAQARLRSRTLSETALFESDRALALGEEARDLSALMGTLEYQARVRRDLSELPGPTLRPRIPGQATPPAAAAQTAPQRPAYALPVDGKLVLGTGEISNSGVHARGLPFETARFATVVSPGAGRIVYAGPFRGYGDIVIIEHGGGWSSLVTGLGGLGVKVGQTVQRGSPLGRTGGGKPRVTVELRQGGRPVPITPLIAGG